MEKLTVEYLGKYPTHLAVISQKYGESRICRSDQRMDRSGRGEMDKSDGNAVCLF